MRQYDGPTVSESIGGRRSARERRKRVGVRLGNWLTAELVEFALLEFFEVMPTLADRDISWDYNDSAYEVSRDNVQLTFALVPASRDVRVVLKIGEHVVYELNAMGIQDIKHHREKGRESLEVILATRDSAWIRLRPRISVNHNMAERV